MLRHVAVHGAAFSGIESVEVVAHGSDGFSVSINEVTVRCATR
jgi:hypothetical protein